MSKPLVVAVRDDTFRYIYRKIFDHQYVFPWLCHLIQDLCSCSTIIDDTDQMHIKPSFLKHSLTNSAFQNAESGLQSLIPTLLTIKNCIKLFYNKISMSKKSLFNNTTCQVKKIYISAFLNTPF